VGVPRRPPPPNGPHQPTGGTTVGSAPLGSTREPEKIARIPPVGCMRCWAAG